MKTQFLEFFTNTIVMLYVRERKQSKRYTPLLGIGFSDSGREHVCDVVSFWYKDTLYDTVITSIDVTNLCTGLP